jgi:hypothetical protein
VLQVSFLGGTFLGYNGGVRDVEFIGPGCEDVLHDFIDSSEFGYRGYARALKGECLYAVFYYLDENVCGFVREDGGEEVGDCTDSAAI